MGDLITALGLVLVLEGMLWALFPRLGLELLAVAASAPPERLRGFGLAAAVAGLATVWWVRS